MMDSRAGSRFDPPTTEARSGGTEIRKSSARNADLYAELAVDMPRWLMMAAFGWLVAFLPWVGRPLWIYAMPRVDATPG
jgi:hypothetical protein